MARERTVVGVSGHNGWAICVSIAARDGEPVVVDRRRIELIEPGLPNQPYEHETHELNAARAEALVKEVRESALHCAERELGRLRSSLNGDIAAIVLRDAVLPALPPSVAEAHASSHVMARADSMMYHDAVCEAAAGLGIAVELIAKGKERQRAADALGIDIERLEAWLAGLRKRLGPPWQKDHQDATARAIAGLGKSAKVRLPK